MKGVHLTPEHKGQIFKFMLRNRIDNCAKGDDSNYIDYARVFEVSVRTIARISAKINQYLKSPLAKRPKV